MDRGKMKTERKKEREHGWVGFVDWAQLMGGWVVGRLCLIAFKRERMLCAAWWDEDEGEVYILLCMYIFHIQRTYISTYLSIYLFYLFNYLPYLVHRIPTSLTPPLLPGWVFMYVCMRTAWHERTSLFTTPWAGTVRKKVAVGTCRINTKYMCRLVEWLRLHKIDRDIFSNDSPIIFL